MNKYAYAYGALEALQERGMPLEIFEKIAYESDNAELMCLASDMRDMLHHQEQVKTAGAREQIVNAAKAYGLPAGLAAGGAGLGLGAAYGASDADTMSNSVRRMLGMPTQSRFEQALGQSPGNSGGIIGLAQTGMKGMAAPFRGAGNFLFNS